MTNETEIKSGDELTEQSTSKPSDYERRGSWNPFLIVAGIGIAVIIIGTVCISVIAGDFTTITPMPTSSGKIAFSSEGAIQTINPDGTGLKRLTHRGSGDGNPSWSPDGSRIAFVRDKTIYIMQSDGSNIFPVLFSPNTLEISDVAWSPDGQQLALVASDVRNRTGISNTKYDIYTTRLLDGGQVNQLTDDVLYQNDLSWSPDSNYIVFSQGLFPSNIYIVPANGGAKTPLTKTDVQNSHPSWSPDGTRIAFASTRGGNLDIWTMRVDGTDVRQVTNDSRANSMPTWSPDSQHLVFRSANTPDIEGGLAERTEYFVANGHVDDELYRIGVDGSVGRLTNNLAVELYPSWSPALP